MTFDQNVHENAKSEFELLLMHLTEKIDDFNELVVLIVHFDERRRVNWDFHVKF